jgi:hypothetical protein
MLNDFLPAVTSIAILAAAFLYAWISDVRRIRRHRLPDSLSCPVVMSPSPRTTGVRSKGCENSI